MYSWFLFTKLHGVTWQNGNLEMISFNFQVILNDTTKFDVSKFPVTSLHINLSPEGLTLRHLLHCKSCLLQENTRQAMYVQRNIEARSLNHFCPGKIIVAYFKCVSVALVIQHAKRMRRII